MSSIKSFPIVMTTEAHQKIKDAAAKSNLPIYKFILEAIEEKIEKGVKHN